MYEKLINNYKDFQPYELNKSLYLLLKRLYKNNNASSLTLIINYLNNPMYGSFYLINNRLFYKIDIKLKTAINYSNIHSNKPYRLEAQRIDDIRYQIEPLAKFMNFLFLQLDNTQCLNFYNIYILKLKNSTNGYIKRSLNHQLTTIINR